MPDPTSLAWLRGQQGQSCLAAASELATTEEEFLLVSQRLARTFPEPLARLAVGQVLLRRRAAAKFPFADRMFFDREGLEQATPYAVAALRAQRFVSVPLAYDLCAGLGGDSLALAEHCDVIALDRERERTSMLLANAEALGPAHNVQAMVADVEYLPLRFDSSAAVFFDPSRRSGGRRLRRVDEYRPPLETLKTWQSRVFGLAAKVSPAVDRASLAGLGECETEFISLGGELREACLWFGGFRTAEVRATVLPGPHTMAERPRRSTQLASPMVYLYEPDPAILRAGLVANLGEQLGLAQLDPTIAYLTGDQLMPTPFARPFRILEAMPFSRRKLQAWLTEHNVGQVTVKKRGSPVDVDSLHRQLRLTGERHVYVILTRLRGVHSLLVAVPA
jgi:hypothetical protein